MSVGSGGHTDSGFAAWLIYSPTPPRRWNPRTFCHSALGFSLFLRSQNHPFFVSQWISLWSLVAGAGTELTQFSVNLAYSAVWPHLWLSLLLDQREAIIRNFLRESRTQSVLFLFLCFLACHLCTPEVRAGTQGVECSCPKLRECEWYRQGL